MTLEELGFDAWFSDQVAPDCDFDPVRVVEVHKGACTVSDGTQNYEAKTTGRLRHQAQSRLDYPTVGDWVLVKDLSETGFGTIQQVLRRRTELKRKMAGRTSHHQLIAANIDTAFIMQHLGLGYNLKRVERYLVMVNESGIEPVILLSKRDLLDEQTLEEVMTELRLRMPGVRVYAFSNTNRQGLNEVLALFEPQRTYCVVGISGVGKTTLLNNLLGEEDFLFTLPVREKDGKGVHTTTWRELVVLENGALVVDTPGMRELGHLDVDDGISETFDDITKLASACRFNDCSHVGTSGCAVIRAVEEGQISSARYDNFVRMMEEAACQEQSALKKCEQDRKLGRFYRSMKARKTRE